jgi:hypothetical protein
MQSDRPKSYRVKYDVHCRFKNHFGKEIVVKNCYSEVHAKFKLGKFCEKTYGKEFDFIKFTSVVEESFEKLFNDILGDTSKGNYMNIIDKLRKNAKKNKK